MDIAGQVTQENMDQDEAAEYLGYRPRTLAALRLQRRGPKFVKLSPRHVRYRRKDLDEFLARHVVETTTE